MSKKEAKTTKPVMFACNGCGFETPDNSAKACPGCGHNQRPVYRKLEGTTGEGEDTP